MPKHAGGGPTGAVVPTDSASANVNCDNGAGLHGTPRLRGRDGGHALVALALLSTLLPYLDRMLDTDLGQLTCPRTRVNGDQRTSERAVRIAVTVSSGASKGTKCPAPGTNRKSRSRKVCSIPSAQAAGLTGSSSPHLTTVGRGIGSLVAQAEVSVSSSYVARYQPKLALRAPGRAKASTIALNSSGRTLSLLPTQ